MGKITQLQIFNCYQRDKLNGPYLIGLFIRILVNVRLHQLWLT